MKTKASTKWWHTLLYVWQRALADWNRIKPRYLDKHRFMLSFYEYEIDWYE